MVAEFWKEGVHPLGLRNGKILLAVAGFKVADKGGCVSVFLSARQALVHGHLDGDLQGRWKVRFPVLLDIKQVFSSKEKGEYSSVFVGLLDVPGRYELGLGYAEIVFCDMELGGDVGDSERVDSAGLSGRRWGKCYREGNRKIGAFYAPLGGKSLRLYGQRLDMITNGQIGIVHKQSFLDEGKGKEDNGVCAQYVKC